MRLALLLCVVLSLPATAAKRKVLVDAPGPLKAALERQLRKTSLVGSTALSADPQADELSRVCLEKGAVAVVVGRRMGGVYTVTVLDGADGSPLGSFKFLVPARGPVAFGSKAVTTLKQAVAQARGPSSPTARPPPEPAPAAEPEPPRAREPIKPAKEPSPPNEPSPGDQPPPDHPERSRGTGEPIAPVAPPEEPAQRPPSVLAGLQVVPTAYVEVSYGYNFNRPANGITAFRGFDNRHNMFLLQTVAGGAGFQLDRLEARVILQLGATASTLFLVEPSLPGASSANASNAEVWKYIQEAWVAYRAPLGSGIRIQAGVCVSPIGAEGIAVKDNWNWSRSNVFFGLPAYHLGARASYDFTDRFSATVAGYNGWNNVGDNNDGKSISANLNYKIPDKLNLQLLYFGGSERPRGAAEQPSWRHLFDGYLQWDLHRVFSLALHADGGFEPNAFGTSAWAAGAVYFRLRPFTWLALSARGDLFYEVVAPGASAIFWPSPWVSSGTGTLEWRPHEQFSVRLEYRHDHAGGPTYFANDPVQATADSQDTIVLGLTGWL